MSTGCWAPAITLFLAFSTLAFSADRDNAGNETVAMRRTSPPAPEAGNASIRINVPFVLVPVTVTDQRGHLVSDLRQDDFRLSEEGVRQTISSFHRDEAPISVGIVLDSSKSMNPRMEMARRSISAFLERCTPDDEYFLMRFSSASERMQPFTHSPALIETAAARVEAGGWTALYDALRAGFRDMAQAQHGNKVLFVVTDGNDNNSRHTASEIKRLLEEGDVRLFAISIGERSRILERLAESTGGRAYRVRNIEELPDVAEKVSVELHSEYLLGFRPEGSKASLRRRIKVELVGKEAREMHASWRRSYFADPR